MARALNKNKKPETNNKNRACNYFLGSFGSPCSFRNPENPLHTRLYALSFTTIASKARSYSSNLLRPTPSPD